ncbi:RDD family protein [Flavobacterium sp. FlaQc-57]|uniref:RDD family protein n=1 Tax=Flavobacterium sp. FlaQc-57 TaxID=3374186 RepID=UPI003756FC63
MSNNVYIVEKKLLASDRDRFINCILDFLSVFITMFVSSLIVIIVGNVFNWDIFSIWEKFIIDSRYLACLSFLMFNYFVLEWLFGRTMGKLVTGTIVVNKNGLKPDFGVIFIRTLCRLIPLDALSFLGKSEMFWHDSISKTYVVEKKELERDMEIFYSLNLIGVKEAN